MVISYNSQLGLRFKESAVKIKLLELIEVHHQSAIEERQTKIKKYKEIIDKGPENLLEEDLEFIEKENVIKQEDNSNETRVKISNLINLGINEDSLFGDCGKYFLICDSVYKAAALIKINTGFTGRTLKDIQFGAYVYLMGKNEMIRFVVGKGALRGFYYNDKNNIAFEFGYEMEYGNYFFQYGHELLFTKITQVLTFVELGDIEIVELKGGRNNGAEKKSGEKIANTSRNTVYVVDSSWNKLIIRTDGFAVRGHFRLQPCGENMSDRKLIWVNAFEKHGYTRRPKAEIVHN